MYQTAGIIALVALGGAEAFTPLFTGPVLRTRTAPPVCSLSATADTSVSRRSVLSSVVFAAAGLAAPFKVYAEDDDEDSKSAETPAGAPAAVVPPPTTPVEAYKISGNYQADVSSLMAKMKAATMVKRGDPGIKETVNNARDEMNRFTAYYRRNNKVAGAASFSTLYTAISTLSGHFQNYGPEYPVPAKRQKRLLQQYSEIEKQISRGR